LFEYFNNNNNNKKFLIFLINSLIIFIIIDAITYDSYMKRVYSSGASKNEAKSTTDDSTIMVEFNGKSIDVLNTLNKLEKAEVNIQTLDVKLKEANIEIG
jgi:hypothetical protein